MKPNRVKPNKNKIEAENAISLATELLPLSNPKPFPIVTRTSIPSSMPFTMEESSLCYDLKQMQLSVWKSNPVPSDVVNCWIYQRQQMSPDLFTVASQNALEKYVKFVSAIEQFKEYVTI